MLLQENFGEEHIRELQGISHRDPVLLERAVYAFGLLEALKHSVMKYHKEGPACGRIPYDPTSSEADCEYPLDYAEISRRQRTEMACFT